jgi:O-acetylserine/cysteine efflux transporter
MKLKPLHLFLAVFACFLWGFNFVAVKITQAFFPLIFLIGFRFLVIGLVMVPFVKRPEPHQWKKIALIALTFGFLNYTFLYIGIMGVSASTSALIHQLAVPIVAILGFVFLKEKPSKYTILGIVIAMIGVAIITSKSSGSSQFWSAIILLASAFFSATGNVLTKKFGPFDPPMLNGWTSLMAAPLLLITSFVIEDGQLQALSHTTLEGWCYITFSIVGSGMIAFNIWYFLLNKYPVSLLSPLSLMSPMLATLSSILVLGEKLTPNLIIGGLCTLAGIGLVQLKGKDS